MGPRSDYPATTRRPAVAGRFYPAEPERCRRAAIALLGWAGRSAPVATQSTAAPADTSSTAAPGASEPAGAAAREDPPVPAGTVHSMALGTAGPGQTVEQRPWTGAVVPHAGWICSGAIAGEAIRTLAESSQVPPALVVVFGAVHTPVDVDFAALDVHDVWAVPGGESPAATALGRRLAGGGSGLFAVDERLHRHEHAVEVELPLIQAAWPGATILPVEVPLIDQAVEIGRRTAGAVSAAGLRAIYLASSDLTHYGPAYGFAPAGVGLRGLEWAKENDRRVLDLVTELAADRVVDEVRISANACGGGAIAAMLAACKEQGATRARLLRHANSFETLADVAPQPPTDAVGYAAVVVG